MSRFKRICIVLAALVGLSGLGSWVAMERRAADWATLNAEAQLAAEHVVWLEQAAASRLDEFVYDLAVDVAPGSAEALPPQPGADPICYDFCLWPLVATYDLAARACVVQYLGPGEQDCGPGETGIRCGVGECIVGSNDCAFCIGDAWDTAYNWGAACYDMCMGHGTDCSPTNPWC